MCYLFVGIDFAELIKFLINFMRGIELLPMECGT